MLKRKPRVVEWNSCIDVPLSRGVLGRMEPKLIIGDWSLKNGLANDRFWASVVHVLLLDRCTRPAEKRGTAHADLLVGAQVLADQCKQSAGDSIWVSPTIPFLLCNSKAVSSMRHAVDVVDPFPGLANHSEIGN